MNQPPKHEVVDGLVITRKHGKRETVMTIAHDPMAEYGPAIKPALAAARKRLTKKTQKPKAKKAKIARVAQTTPARVALQRAKPEEVILKAPHWINGTAYGPGRVSVAWDVAQVLRENERRVQENNDNFDGKRAAYIGPSGRRMPVPYDMFDSPMLNVMEAMTIQKS
jgi:hypothetical protein